MIFYVVARRSLRALCLMLAASLLSQASLAATVAGSLSLNEATQRVLADNPELQLFRLRLQAIDGRRQSAALAPAYEFGVSAENILGSGDFSGADSAELTLSISSVIELGGQREARIVLADSRFALAQARREARALDLLGDVTQRFIAALALQRQLAVASEATRLAEDSLALVRRRVASGAAPEAERLRAKAALIEARLQQAALSAQFSSRRLELATLWGDEQADFLQLSGDLFRFETPAGFDALYRRALSMPAIAVYASETRLREAELALVRSQSASNLQWSLGIRRFEASDDTALTAGVSVPLFGARRNRGDVAAALAERDAVESEREIALRHLRSRLFAAWQSHRQNVDAVTTMRAQLLPALESALAQTREAYERGRYSYADWVAAQRDLLDARRALIESATAALLNQALIEQLTAQPLSSPQSSKWESHQ